MNRTERAIQRGHLEVDARRCPRCNKVIFYSKAAAMSALQRLVAIRLIEYGQIGEKDVYICHPKFRMEVDGVSLPVYHLTSQSNGHVDQELKNKRAERAWEAS